MSRLALTAAALLICAPLIALAGGIKERLDKGEILVKSDTVGERKIPRSTVTAVIEAPPEAVWAIVTDCANFKHTMPRVIASDNLGMKDGKQLCKTTVETPFPLPNLTSLTGATTKVKNGRWVRSWSLIEGDYEVVDGKWVLARFKDDPNRTLAVYRIAVEPKIPLPDAVQSLAQRKTLPGLIERIREEVKKRAAK